MLSSVTVTGYPTQYFVYQDSVAGHGSQPYTPPSGVTLLRTSNSEGDVTQTIMDMNGDGYVDLVKSAAGGTWSIYLGSQNGFASTAVGWSASNSLIRDVTVSGDWSSTNKDTFDITGDGIPDYVDTTTWTAGFPYWRVYPGGYANYGFGTAINWSAPSALLRQTKQYGGNTNGSTGQVYTYRDVLDINGDGLPDLVVSGYDGQPSATSYTWSVYLNNGSGFDLALPYFPAPKNTIEAQYYEIVGTDRRGGIWRQLMDFNGDGLVDLVVSEDYYKTPGITPPDLRCTDLNGDGQADVLQNCAEIYLNTGQGFAAAPQVTGLPLSPPLFGDFLRGWDWDSFTYRDVVDLNGDGLPDLVTTAPSANNTWQVLLNQGGKFEPTAVWNGSGWQNNQRTWPGTTGAIRKTTVGNHSNTTIDLLDFNGDGMIDRVVAGSTSWTVQRNLNAAKPNLLTTAQNGLGGTTSIFYKPSTLFDNTGGDFAPDLPFVIWVTSGTRRLDGLCTPTSDSDVWSTQLNLYVPASNTCITDGHELAQAFTYRDGRFNATAREFRGFRTVVSFR